MIAATGTNLQSVMDAIAQNAAELCDAVEHRGVAGRRQGQQRRCTLWIDPMRQVQEEDDEIDRVFTLERHDRPRSGGRSQKSRPDRSM